MKIGIKEGFEPILFEITGLPSNGYSYFQMDSKDYSMFPYE